MAVKRRGGGGVMVLYPGCINRHWVAFIKERVEHTDLRAEHLTHRHAHACVLSPPHASLAHLLCHTASHTQRGTHDKHTVTLTAFIPFKLTLEHKAVDYIEGLESVFIHFMKDWLRFFMQPLKSVCRCICVSVCVCVCVRHSWLVSYDLWCFFIKVVYMWDDHWVI